MAEEAPKKKRRGRPPGSKSKKKKEAEGEAPAKEGAPAKKRRGRPPGSKSKKKQKEEEESAWKKEVEQGPPELKVGYKKARTASRRMLEDADEAARRQQQGAHLLVSLLTDRQKDRHMAYRRGKLTGTVVRKVMSSVSPLSVPRTSQVAVQAAAKLYVGDLVEEARRVQREEHLFASQNAPELKAERHADDDEDDEGDAELPDLESCPIRPWHLQEAYRRLSLAGKAPAPHLAAASPFRPRFK